MLHLFNKVYLQFDDSIDCHTNRYVISEEKGNPMLSELGSAYRGTLINYAKNRNEMQGKFDDLTGFFEDVCTKQKSLNSKVVIYCDTQAFLELSVIDSLNVDTLSIADLLLLMKLLLSDISPSGPLSFSFSFLGRGIISIRSFNFLTPLGK